MGVLLAGPGAAAAPILDLERPGERDFVVDLAGMVDGADEAEIRGIADRLLTERRVPLFVVTIDSMAQHGGAGLSIESFARVLFDEWGIGVLPENQGILLLVSEGDRKARIEMGLGWAHTKDAEARRIMDDEIIARFKQGRFSDGILAGVQSLDLIARDQALPEPAGFRIPLFWVVALAGLGVFTAVSLMRRGRTGWAWVAWAAVFGLVFLILKSVLSSSGNGGSSGGGYSGGGFGGGSSGGGGASGGW
jgi:uncharacterized protein